MKNVASFVEKHAFALFKGKAQFHFLQLMFISKFTPQHFLYHSDLETGVSYCVSSGKLPGISIVCNSILWKGAIVNVVVLL